MSEIGFIKAKPVWPRGKDKEMNVTVGFRAVFDWDAAQNALLCMTGSSLYRVYVNGEFAGHGPARGPHGFYRMDEWELSPYLKAGKNMVAIEVVGYNVNSYYLPNQPAFLQAEIRVDGTVLRATSEDSDDFQAALLSERIQKVQRYSFQRPFIEYYRWRESSHAWRTDDTLALAVETCAEAEHKAVIARGISYSTFQKRSPVAKQERERFTIGNVPEVYWKDRSLTDIGPTLGGYAEGELEVVPTLEMQEVRTIKTSLTSSPYKAEEALRLSALSCQIIDWGLNRTGFLGGKFTCRERTKLYLIFDELVTDGDIDFTRMDCANVIGCELEAGSYDLESFEPYTMRYVKLLVMDGHCEVEALYLREYNNPDTERAVFQCNRAELNAVYAAGAETFRQNASDLLMDCPSRERAGWLCDSFFTARVEHVLTGGSKMERSFLENYLLPERFDPLPAGMLPMCYPADHDDGNFIPNWALWFILELQEYLARTGDLQLVQALKPKVYALFDYFRPFLNEDNLLENLEQWVFIEWSKANDYVQDVNYPSNMLYAAALQAAGSIYDDFRLAEQASGIRHTIAEQSYNGSFFIDNAVRIDGKLQLTNHTTEVCQYYAFYFGIATPDSHPELWTILVDQFGPSRDARQVYPDVPEANAFIGNYLRLDLLSLYGRSRQLLEQMEGYFIHMAERTGTLWEHAGNLASCNHGFASHVVYWLYQDALGLKGIDPIAKKLIVQFEDNGLHWCEGAIPAGTELIKLQWRLEGERIYYSLHAPSDYKVRIVNNSGKELIAAIP
jgi:alpha-L-rhamnosidase